MNRELDSPCPPGNSFARSGVSNEQEYQLTDPWNDGTLDAFENTAAIDFTTEIRVPALTREKPRRAHKKASFFIHEDDKPSVKPVPPRVSATNSLKRKPEDGRSSLLAQPAQRFQRPRVNVADKLPSESLSTGKQTSIDRQRRGRGERQSCRKEPQSLNTETTPNDDSLKKKVRRQTVYIPAEDTTMPSVFMNLFSPLKSDRLDVNRSQPSNKTVPINSLEARIAEKSKPRASIVPRRAPLQQSNKVTQQLGIHRDVLGKNGGKENIPPGFITGDGKKFATKDEGFPVFEVPAKKQLQSSVKTTQQTATIVSNKVEKDVNCKNKKPVYQATEAKASTGLRTRNNHTQIKSKVHNNASLAGSETSVADLPTSKRPVIPTKLSGFHIRPVNVDRQYPLLDDDISNPMMYEENWLLHQEIVITQLMNGLFDSADGKLDVRDSDVLRHELLQIYQSDSFLLLYKRLHASILYGALAPPKEILRRGSRLADDLGMKRAFLNFWLETYDLNALRAAAEVVIGRRISNTSCQFTNRPSDSLTKQHKGLKRTLEAFLETFLIRNDDKERTSASKDEISGWPYRRTVLRSVLIVILLDKGRLTSNCTLPKCLFTTSSPHKSSAAALQALANQLLPSMGDIVRQLNHLDCQLSYKQHELQNYEFRINNLAVDLRDGVILTRLVEVLLYPSALRLSSGKDGFNPTTPKVHIGASEDVEMEIQWPLSQHLKFPCTSRATKVFNVQVALKALADITDMKAITQDIQAEDIVDGHREKTIALLWGLVGKWGLPELIDWDDVRNEIIRLQKKLISCSKTDVKEDGLNNLDCESHKSLLVKWASTLAQLKGLQVDNLSTSFADGRIFESIIDEYESYFAGEQNMTQNSTSQGLTDETSTVRHRRLHARLQSLGCSTQFASLVAPPPTGSRILDRDFVFGALTFLCSRLLASSKRIRAAIIIQAAWRRVLACRTLRQRVLAKKAAEQCAAVVRARDRILWAKGVIVKWWRKQNQKKGKTTKMHKSTEALSYKSRVPLASISRRNQRGKKLASLT